jgi:hypothetical protein
MWPRLVLPERYERRIKWGLRSITAVGIGTSVLSLSPAAALALAVGLLGLEQILERTVFLYTTMYVRALPFQGFEKGKWTSMAYLYGAASGGR